MAYEISKSLRYKTISVTTPLDVAEISFQTKRLSLLPYYGQDYLTTTAY